MTVLAEYSIAVWMTGLFPWLAGLFTAASGLGCAYLLLASGLVLRFPRPTPPQSPHVPVTVLKPLCGAEPGLLRRMRRLCNQNYAGPVQIVFGVQSRNDPALEAVERLRQVHPQAQVVVKVDRRIHGSNLKVSNLANMAELARHDILVVSDSDIEVGPDYLAGVINELQQPGVGAVSCLYHATAETGLWARLSALGLNTHFLPGVVTALTFNLSRPCFGATIACSRNTLERIGGFGAFADCLADDHAIGEAVRASGLEVAIPRFSVAHVCMQARWRELWTHQLRFARTIRSIDPVGHAGAVITHPMPLALAGALFGNDHALTLAAIALACRLVLCACVERAFALPRQPYWLIPVQDLLAFAVTVASFFGTAVSWRGYRYRVLSDGTLIEDR